MTMELSASILVASGEGELWAPEIRKRSLERIMRIAHKSFMSYPFELDPCECGEPCCNMGETCSPCREAYN
jgi:hypothetical protein